MASGIDQKYQKIALGTRKKNEKIDQALRARGAWCYNINKKLTESENRTPKAVDPCAIIRGRRKVHPLKG